MRKLSLKKFNRNEEGQALVLICVGLTMLLMMAGLGVDVGYLHYQKDQMQKAADSAALAGAEAYSNNDGKANSKLAAQADATVNGFTDGSNGISVTVNIPPATPGDPYNGKNGYVEVIVAQARPTFFMKAGGWGGTNVSSRAVAAVAASASGCIWALDPSSSETFRVNGNVSITSSCGIYVDSNDSDALHINGNSGYVNAGTAGAGIGVVGPSGGGGWSPGGPYCAGSGFCPSPVNIPTFTDPLAKVSPPPTPTACGLPSNLIQGNTYNPGVYCNGLISITGNGAYVFKPGLYTLCNGGMKIGGNAKVTGTGVTIYNTGNVPGVCNGNNYAPVSLKGTSGTSLSAPTSGSGCDSTGCAGILVFQDRAYISTKNNDASSIDGTAGATFTGALYFPGTNVTYAGTPNVQVSSAIIGWQLTFSGNTQINDDLLIGGGSPITTAALAE